MSKNDVIKQINCDEEFKLSDYTPAELEKNFKKTQVLRTSNLQKYEKNKNFQKFKDDYFAFYDDIKSHTLKKQDW